MKLNLAPEIRKQKLDITQIKDITPARQRPQNISVKFEIDKENLNNDQDLVLPQIYQTQTQNKNVEKRDFFKLHIAEAVEYEQYDQTIKKLYNQQIKSKQANYLIDSITVDKTNLLPSNNYLLQKQKAQFIKQNSFQFNENNLSELQQLATLTTDNEPFEANQKITRHAATLERQNNFRQFSNEINNQFDDATKLTFVMEKKRQSLFTTILRQDSILQQHINNEKQNFRRGSNNKFLLLKKRFSSQNKSNQSIFQFQKKIADSKHLLDNNINLSPTKLRITTDKQISQLYIPSKQRQFKSTLTKKLDEEDTQKMKQEKNKKIQFDLNQFAIDLQKLNQDEQQNRKNKKNRVKQQNQVKQIKRRSSFTEGQMKYDDAKNLWNPVKEKIGVSLKNVLILRKMIKHKRYPVPEKLIHMPKDINYDLFIDTMIIQAYNSDENKEQQRYKQEVDAPQNSMESQEEIDFESSSESETDMIPQPQNRKEKKEAKQRIEKVVKESLDLHGFDMDQLKAYPHQYTEGEPPIYLLHDRLKGKVENLEKEVQKKIAREFKEKKMFPTIEHVYLAYEHYCQEFYSQPLDLSVYYKKGLLHFKNQGLPPNQLKAVCCTIPLVQGLKHVKFENNNLNDDMIAIILLACYMNPDVQILSFYNNFLRQTAANTYFLLSQTFPDRIREINLISSIYVGDHVDNWTRNAIIYENLHTLNIQGIPISMPSCKNIGYLLINSRILKSLNVSSCKIGYQGTRYLIDGLNRNQGLQYFDFAMNDMSSSIYEFSIKLAKIITRHQQIMHVDVAGSGLKKEEVLFIGMAVSSSKSCIALHLSANNLDYYERIFLRTLVNAQISYHFRNMAQEQKKIRSQKERNQIFELKNHDFDNQDLKEFVKQWNFIDQQRLGIDDEINKILKELDITEIFKQLRKGNKSQIEKNDLLQDIIQKIQNRQEELANMKDDDIENLENEQQEYDLDDARTLTNFKQLGLYNMDADGKLAGKEKRDLKEADDQGDDFWIIQNALKVDRIKKRLDGDKEKKKRSKSAGEMALMFMGINKIAYDLLLENPMTGYMNEVIFSRLLGNEEVEGGHIWKDCSQCFVCEKWDKTQITYLESDQKVMKQSISKLGDLHQVLKQCVDLQIEKLVKKVPRSKVQKMYDDEEGRDQNFGFEMIKNKQQQEEEEYVSLSTPTNEKIFTDSEVSMREDNYQTYQELDYSNTISPIKVDKINIQKMLPKNSLLTQNIVLENHGLEIIQSEESDIETYKQLAEQQKQKTDTKPKNKKKLKVKIVIEKDENDDVEKNNEQNNSDESDKKSQTDINKLEQNVEEVDLLKSRKNRTKVAKHDNIEQDVETGKKYKIIQRTVFYSATRELKNIEGQKHLQQVADAAFMIEEEISIDSNETHSMHTSEDDFQVDHDTVIKDFNNKLHEQQQNIPIEYQTKIKALEKLLDKNKAQLKENLFGRFGEIYIIPSFNDWMPIEMKSIYEIKKSLQEGSDLEKWCQKQKLLNPTEPIKSKKKDENIIQNTQYIPPGKHYFYFIYNREQIFLSPRYDIVRFKGTNVFINQITVKERTKELQQVTLGRNVYTTEAIKFNKDKSVFKLFQEDTPEFLLKMLEQDLKFGKLSRLSKTEKDAKLLKEAIYKYYLKTKNIFLYIASNSSYPTMGLNDFTSFVHRSELFDKTINLSTVDRNFIATNVSNNPYKNSAERELHRYEFIEVIVRLALSKYKDTKVTATLQDAVEKILSEDIIPKNPAVDGFNFREEHMYNLKVDEIFKKNEQVIKKLYDSFLNPNKKFITLEECSKLLKNAKLNVNDSKVSPCYAESMMSRIDTLSDLSALQQMKYVEFLVFIARVSYEVYKGTKQDIQGLHLKIDACLGPLLETIFVQKQFSFKEDLDDEQEAGENISSEDQDEYDNISDGSQKESKPSRLSRKTPKLL